MHAGGDIQAICESLGTNEVVSHAVDQDFHVIYVHGRIITDRLAWRRGGVNLLETCRGVSSQYPMATESVHQDAVRRAREILLSHPAVEAAYLLGSAAEDRLRCDSDVDIAILVRRSCALSVEDRLILTATLGTIFGRPVDLGLLATSNLVYAKEAISRGRLLAERDHAVTATFAMYVLSMYATLQEARREVLRAYAA